MSRRTRKALLLAIGAVLLFALPIVGTLAVSHGASRDRSQERMNDVTARVAQRVEEVLLTTEAALADLAYDARNGCTEHLIAQFRNATITLGPLLGLALVSADGRLECTTFGQETPPQKIPAMSLLGPVDSPIRFTLRRAGDYVPEPHIAAVHALRNGSLLVAAINPESLIDVVPPDVLGADGRIAVRLYGAEAAELGVREIRAPSDMTAESDVGLYGAKVLASASQDWVLADWRSNALVLASLGGAAGLVLVLGAMRLARKRLSLAAELREGLDNEEFEIWYQPVIDLQSTRCLGAEALIRWRHPERDLIPPDLFITMAEETGIIIPMTRWLMEDMGQRIGPLLRSNRSLHIAINLAPQHVSDYGIVADARKLVAQHGIEPDQILFELTERSLIDDPKCRDVVRELGAMGSEVAVDDFGTGYSSLAYIDKFKLDYLKLDKAFVSAVGDSSPAARLTEVIIDMAASLGLKTIAEGVETEEQVRFLRERGVTCAQGWYFSKPLTAEDFIAYVTENATAGPETTERMN